jgi:hypothetical protein
LSRLACDVLLDCTMSSVAPIGNIYRSPRTYRRISVILLGAALISSAAVVAVARSGQSTGFNQQVARFNFTGTFRFKPTQLIKQPSRRLLAVRQTVVATASIERTKSLPPRLSSPQTVISSKAEPPKNQIASKPTVSAIGKPEKHADRRGFGMRKPAAPAHKPTTTTAPQAASNAQQIPSRQNVETAALSTQGQQFSKISRVDKSLRRSNRSSLGASSLKAKIERVSSGTDASRVGITPSPTKTIAQVATSLVTAPPRQEIIQVASATLEKSEVSLQQAPVTRSARSAATPPLPAKYRRPVTARTKRRPVTKKRVLKTAIARTKLKSKSKPASNWLSASPRWASGAFKSE